MRVIQRRTLIATGILVLGLVAVGLVAALPFALSQGVTPPPSGPGVSAPPGPDPGPGPYWGGPHRFGGPGFGPRPFVLFWVAGLVSVLHVLVLVGLILVLWRLLGARLFWQRLDPAMRVLRERYARGEISDDEYHKRLATLA